MRLDFSLFVSRCSTTGSLRRGERNLVARDEEVERNENQRAMIRVKIL